MSTTNYKIAIIFTADEKNNTLGELEYETIIKDYEYKFTIKIEEDYLKDEKTVYPITIDPSIEINYTDNGTGAIEDVTINEVTTHSGTSGSLQVGRHSDGSLSRTLMRFPDLSLDGICANQITAASVKIRDVMCQGDEDISVNCYVYKKTAPSWSESGTTTWSSVGTDYEGNFQDTHVISYGQGNVSANWYSYNILNAARGWANDFQSPSKGLVFRASAAFENQTGNSVKKWVKTFASYNRANYKPSLSITYTDGVKRDLCYSEYDPGKYNYGDFPGNNSSTYLPRYRMNCYGYAVGFILDDCATLNSINGGWTQVPGDFSSSNSVNVSFYGGNSDSVAQKIMNNIILDMESLGYEVSPYYEIPNSIDQAGYGERIVALVTNTSPWHFYMQNSDGTWSHKMSSYEVTNQSLKTANTTLNNNNIVDECLGDNEFTTKVFFKIIKPSTVEFRHGGLDTTWNRRHCNIISGERAGDYFENSVTKPYGSTSARIDHPKDHDVFCFVPTSTRNYTIFTSNASSAYADMNCSFYDGAGTFWQSDTASGNVYTTLRLVAGKNYYIDIWNDNEKVTTYNLSIY